MKNAALAGRKNIYDNEILIDRPDDGRVQGPSQRNNSVP